jgi:hypothetical protein
VVVAFRKGVRDEKILERLTTHDIQDVYALFSLADKCAKATKGRTWYSPIDQVAKGQSKPNAETQAQGGDNGNNNNKKKKKKKKADDNQPLARAPTAATAAAGGAVGAKRRQMPPSSIQ